LLVLGLLRLLGRLTITTTSTPIIGLINVGTRTGVLASMVVGTLAARRMGVLSSMVTGTLLSRRIYGSSIELN
jgi:hypothetical protein